MPLVKGIGQCKCWSAAIHDGHCWYCEMPILYQISRSTYITDQGHSASVCESKECQERADKSDRTYGMPVHEVMRRRHPHGIREDLEVEELMK